MAASPQSEALQQASKHTNDKDMLIKRLNNKITQLEHDLMDKEEAMENGHAHKDIKQNGTGAHVPVSREISHSPTRKLSTASKTPVPSTKKPSTVTNPGRVKTSAERNGTTSSVQANSVAQKKVVRKKSKSAK